MGKHTVTGQPTGALHFMCPYYKYDAHNLQLLYMFSINVN